MISGVLLVLTKNVFLEECKRKLIVGIDVLLVLRLFCWEKKRKNDGFKCCTLGAT